MKIIQSFWSKPSLAKVSTSSFGRHLGGWSNKRFNYRSWALSCLQYRLYYEEVELVTDKRGYDLLINKMGLPYTRVQIILDDLNAFDADLWALGKIYAYGAQDMPFIHTDADTYIWGKFSDVIEGSSLIAQNIETDFVQYGEVLQKMQEEFFRIPKVLTESQQKNGMIVSANAGIIGGNRVDFFKSFSTESLQFVIDNIDRLKKINKGLFNQVFEQFLFSSLAGKWGIPITYLLENINSAYDGLADIMGTPNRINYVHMVGKFKQYDFLAKMVSYQLLKNYPEVYFHIEQLIKQDSI